MGRNCPLHNAHPFGAKLKLMILISDKNGSAMLLPPWWVVAETKVCRTLPSLPRSVDSTRRASAPAARGRTGAPGEAGPAPHAMTRYVQVPRKPDPPGPTLLVALTEDASIGGVVSVTVLRAARNVFMAALSLAAPA